MECAMSKGVFYYTDEFQAYDMGPQHPLKPARLRRTHDLLAAYGALAHVEVEAPRPCPIDDLMPTHSAEFVETVDRLSAGEHVPFPFRYGFGQGDNPVFPEMYEASLLYTGASLQAAEDLVSGRARAAMNISGGLHHAHRDRAAGFCVFNDCAVAIHRLLRRFSRVAYLDIDVHHGDGVQEAFYDDPRVLTISIHETGTTLFPGTGFPREIGVSDGIGYSVNLPMYPYTDDDIWLSTWRQGGLPVMQAFNPEAVVIDVGTDPHYLDPLARICLTAQGWTEAVHDVMGLNVPVLALGGGGYNPTTVPRMWALVFSEIFGVPLANEVPEAFADRDRIPTLRDDEPAPIAPHALEQARAYSEQTLADLRKMVFGYHGL
jgi:acetoin utilization protein AcuC